MTDTTKTVTKKEAATCQLETAIKLLLENRDLISAYTLCCAADGILEGIYENERDEILQRQCDQSTSLDNFRFSWGEELKIRIKPEHRREVFRVLNAPQNFFKHADRDHDDTYEFPDWELTGLRTATTVINYNLVFGETTPAMRVFFTLYAILKPDLFADGKPSPDAWGSTLDPRTISKALSREDVTAVGYSALKLNSPSLFQEPRPVTGVWPPS